MADGGVLAAGKRAVLPVYPLLFHIFRLPVELLNLFLRGVDVGDINISRRSKGVPDHPAPVAYPFITVLSVGAGCVYIIRWQLPALCILHNAYTGQWPHPAVTRPSFQEGSAIVYGCFISTVR